MSTRIHNQQFHSFEEASEAQIWMMCAECNGPLKVQRFEDGYWLLCFKRPHHHDLRERLEARNEQ